MTARKPPGVSFPGWVERQIRTAEASGAFDNLAGAGKPIPDLDRRHDDLAWVANYLRRENVDATELLPPGLALAKEVEQLPARLRREKSELRVRRYVDDLNERIRQAHARPQVGPPVRVRTVDVEAVVAQWRDARPRPAAAIEPVAEPVARTRRRRWLRRRARRASDAGG